MFVLCTVGNGNNQSVWVVEVRTFLKDGLKDILLEQSAHVLSDMTL